jgi:hypothetical protein
MRENKMQNTGGTTHARHTRVHTQTTGVFVRRGGGTTAAGQLNAVLADTTKKNGKRKER